MSNTSNWKQIHGFPAYWVSDNGEVFSLLQSCTGKCTGDLKQRINNSGYRGVTLCKNKKKYSRRVHRLVLETFIGPCPEGKEACHNNGNRLDNRLSNLRWDTRSNNIRDAVRQGTHSCLTQWGEGHNMAKLKEAEVKEIRRLYSTGLWTQFQLADSFGVGHSNISAITTRRSWRHI